MIRGRGRAQLEQERARWAPNLRRDRTTEYRPAWWSVDELSREAFDELAALPPMIFALVAELCAAKGWPGERSLKLVRRAIAPSSRQRRSTTTRARRALGRALGRRVDYDKYEQLEAGA